MASSRGRARPLSGTWTLGIRAPGEGAPRAAPGAPGDGLEGGWGAPAMGAWDRGDRAPGGGGGPRAASGGVLGGGELPTGRTSPPLPPASTASTRAAATALPATVRL